MLDHTNALQLETKERPDPFRKGVTEVQIRAKQVPQPIATIAMDFIGRWGMIAAVPDGEDSSGRQQVRLQTPQELVTRAVQTAEILFDVIAARGWVLDVPAPKEPELTNGDKDAKKA